jgi:hypothetical protein
MGLTTYCFGIFLFDYTTIKIEMNLKATK